MESREPDEMDSLFEGMILFNPSQMPAMKDEDRFDRRIQSADTLPLTHPPVGDASVSASSSLSSGVSEPLDENLFTDLTLMTSPIHPQPDLSTVLASAPTTSKSTSKNSAGSTISKTQRGVTPLSPSRSTSSRKKKRAGLRIGYGRDEQSYPSESELSPSFDASDLILGRQATQAVRVVEAEPAEETSSPGPSDSHILPTTTFAAKTTATELACTPIEDDLPDTHQKRKDDLPDNTYNCLDSSNTEHAISIKATRAEDFNSVHNNGCCSIELKFEQIKAEICEKLKHVRGSIASVSAARRDCTKRRRKDAGKVNLASTKYRALERDLEAACEAEDFESAERVSESLAYAEKEKQLLAIALRDAEAECAAADSKMQEALALQIAAEEECASLLRSFAMDAANNADTTTMNLEVMSSRELDQWHSSTETLEVKKMELEIESNLMNEARMALTDSIDHLVQDDKRERGQLYKEKNRLTEELEKLLTLVKEKETEIAENNSKIVNVEKKIADTISGFQDAQTTIDKRCSNLHVGLCQIELENEALFMKKKQLDDYICIQEERREKIKEIARISADEALVYQEVVGWRRSLAQFILESREDKVRLAKAEEKLLEDVELFKQEVSASRVSLQELSSTKSSIQQEIESLKQRLIYADKRIPELEAEKKVAAAARNFKEAARLATEAKTLCAEKEGIQFEMDRAILEFGKLEEEMFSTLKRMQETEALISLKENKLAMARFQRLRLTAGAATAERTAALELGDYEEADILHAEAEAADTEAEKLKLVHNFKEEELVILQKQFIAMDLVTNLGGKQLAELVASVFASTL